MDHNKSSSSVGVRWVLAILLLISGIYLVVDHGEHFAPYLPFTFLLGCLAMHFFMHGGHNSKTCHPRTAGLTPVNSMRNISLISVGYGVGAALVLLVVYFVILTLVSGWNFAQSQFVAYWYFIVSLVTGFGIQIALYQHIKYLVQSGAGMGLPAETPAHAVSVAGGSAQAGKVVGASGATSSVAMISCCAHYLVNLVPILGVTGVVTFVAQYQIGLFWVGILANVVGIGYMANRIGKITRT